ncbi:unnamed protein product, partial [Discosporangium mesarthrocarpum]
MLNLISRTVGAKGGCGLENPNPPQRGASLPDDTPRPDPDMAKVMGTFVSPRCFGHYGFPGDLTTLAYEPLKGVIAVASHGGLVKVSGAAGVELVLRNADTEVDPPSHLAFPDPDHLVGISTSGYVWVWDLRDGNPCGVLPPPKDWAASGEHVSSVHCPQGGAEVGGTGGAGAGQDCYVFVGTSVGTVRVVQVLPVCRMSGYSVTLKDAGLTGGNEGWFRGSVDPLMGQGKDRDQLSAVTCIASPPELGTPEGGEGRNVLFGYGGGEVVLWDWVRRKRLGLYTLSRDDSNCDGRDHQEGGAGDRKVTGLAFHPQRDMTFAAGYAAGCFAVFSTASGSRSSALRRWVGEAGGPQFTREGPAIVRTPVSHVQWVGVSQEGDKVWALAVAGGVEMDEGEEPDGVSLLLPAASAWVINGMSRKSPKRGAVAVPAATVADTELEQVVFLPFATGQERVSCVHVVSQGGPGGRGRGKGGEGKGKVGSGRHMAAVNDAADAAVAEEEEEGEREELAILGLVCWTEEVRDTSGRLRFRRASSVQACPVQIHPFVGLLQLAPQRLPPHLFGYAPVTAVASAPLSSSAATLNLAAGLTAGSPAPEEDSEGGQAADKSLGGGEGGCLSWLLRGGRPEWAEGVPPHLKDDSLAVSELLILGHSDGIVSLWEGCSAAPRGYGVSIVGGEVRVKEVPAALAALGAVHVAELIGGEGSESPVTALDVWVERDHLARGTGSGVVTGREGEGNGGSCWAAVGLEGGEVAVLSLSGRGCRVLSGGYVGYGAGGSTSSSLGSQADRAVAVTQGCQKGTSSGEGLWGRIVGGEGAARRGAGRGVGAGELLGLDAEKEEEEDKELEAAIAEAKAEVIRIEKGMRGWDSNRDADADPGPASAVPQGLGSGLAAPSLEEGKEIVGDEQKAGLGEAGESPLLALPVTPPSVLSSVLRMHNHPLCSVALSYDPEARGLALVAADRAGMVSVTDVNTGRTSFLPVKAPQSTPCQPTLAIGPFPEDLQDTGLASRGWLGDKRQGRVRGHPPRQGTAGALFICLDGWMNVFDLASRDPVGLVKMPGWRQEESTSLDGRGRGMGTGTGRGGKSSSGRSLGASGGSGGGGGIGRGGSGDIKWLFCVDDCGLPLTGFAMEAGGIAVDGGVADNDAGAGGGSDEWVVEDGGGGEGGTLKQLWVTLSPAPTALDSYHEYELQGLSGSPPTMSHFVAVGSSGAFTATIEALEPSGVAQRQGHQLPIAFSGANKAALAPRARCEMPPLESHMPPPEVTHAGVCMVGASGAGGDAARRGCLVLMDALGFVTVLLLPSLTPVFREQLPDRGGITAGAPRAVGAAGVERSFACNLIGELTVQSGPTELTRWSIFTEEAYEAALDAKPRLAKVSSLGGTALGSWGGARAGDFEAPGPVARMQSLGDSVGSQQGSKRKTSVGGMLQRLSLGGGSGSRHKTLTDVFAVEEVISPAASRVKEAPPPAAATTAMGNMAVKQSPRQWQGGRGAMGAGQGSKEQCEHRQREELFVGALRGADGEVWSGSSSG